MKLTGVDMNRRSKIDVCLIAMIITIIMAIGCGKADNTLTDNILSEGYSFEADGVSMMVDGPSDEIIKSLGEPLSYYEVASCAFEGLDKMYSYGSFELVTYTDEEVDYISEISLKDDSVTTVEGIYIGSDRASVIEAYGEDYTLDADSYIYVKGNSKLTFVITDDEVKAIRYNTMIFDDNKQ